MTRPRLARHLLMATLAALSLFVGPLLAGEGQDDLSARRARLLEALGPEAMLVVWSAPTRLYSLDVDYEYRQDSSLLYLTGIDQEDTILVLMPGNKTRKEILFTRPADPRHEHTQGHILTKEEATEKSGIATVHTTPEFEAFASAMFTRRPFGMRRRPKTGEYDAFFAALKKGTARLELPLSPQPRLSDPLETPFLFAGKVRERYVGVTVKDVSDRLFALRQVKTPFEQKVLRKSVEISSAAHRAGMRTARPGRYEYEVEAAMEQVYLASGAMSPGYPSIVAGGPNATILHYSDSSRRLEEGDLLLVDAAANYQGLTGDITRTYPVSGRFTEAQKDIYKIVLEAQEAGMKAARVGARTDDVEQAAEDVVKAGLLSLGLITDAKGEQFRTFYTHGICHWIGMDVHDVGDYERPLASGMAFVVEPGIYLREAALKELPDTPENKAFIEKVTPVLTRYKDIGVRIEDSFLLTESGLERLSASVPRTIEEVENFLRDGGQASN